LDAQYAALQGADGAAGGASSKQLADLQKQRDDLYNKMVDQIKRDAGQVASKRGLRVVFMSIEGAAGGIDLTDDVEKDIESLHQ
jgi:Skp family chaperone for outer membrane proteins